MAESIDVQAREDLYKEMLRAKEAESHLGFALQQIKEALEELKNSFNPTVDDAPTRDSNNLVTSGAVYQALMTLNRKIDALR